MRSENSIKSIITSSVSNVLTMLMGFVARAVFIRTLGNEYLGINGLFTNILSMLAIAEMGFGSAIIVNLYKPVAKNQTEKIKSLIDFYKKIYRIIAVVVTILGIAIIPFLGSIVGNVNISINIYLIFLLYLADTVFSYLLTYKRSILYANQKKYLIDLVHIGYVVLLNISQIIYLFVAKDFIGYLVIKIAFRVIENVVITIIANRRYPYMKDKDIKPINKRLKASIFIRVKGLIFHKIGYFLVLGSDNIIISMLPNLGIIQVGLYSNYNMIITAIALLLGQCFSALTSSVGNLLVENNSEKTFSIYKSTLLANAWMYTFSAISIFMLSKPFINIWLGNEYVLSNVIVFVLVVNFYINGMRQTYNTFKEAAGIFYQDRFVPLIESVVNIVVSVVLGYFMGLAGVFIGTIASNMVLFVFSFPKFVYKKILHGNIIDYLKENGQYALLFAISFAITYLICSNIPLDNNWLKLIVYAVICLLIPNTVYLIVKRKSPEFTYYTNLLSNIKNKIFKGNKVNS